MKERLFESHYDLDISEITRVINQILKENFDSFKDVKNIEKWTVMPVLYFEDKTTKVKFIEEVKYIDELLIPELDKVACISTLATMMEKGKLDIDNMDESSIFALVYYFKDLTVEEITEAIKVLSNDKLLYTIRKKALDVMKRNYIIKYVVDEFNKLNISTDEEINNYCDTMINNLITIDINELLEKSGYTDYVEDLEIKKLEEEVEEDERELRERKQKAEQEEV